MRENRWGRTRTNLPGGVEGPSRTASPNGIVYLVVVVFYYLTGGAFLAHLYSLKVVAAAAVVGLMLLASRGLRVKFHQEATAALLFLSGFVLLALVVSQDPNVGPYFAIPLILLTAFMACHLSDFDEFAAAYVNVISSFAAISLVMQLAASAVPGFIELFPLVAGEHVDYRDAGVHVFLELRGYGHQAPVLPRNAGIAWEPGAYQAFLNLALFLLLYRRQVQKPSRMDLLRALVLISAIVSTFSTAGMLFLLLQLMSFRHVVGGLVGHWRPFRWVAVPVIVLVICVAIGASGFDFAAKVSSEFGSGASLALERVAVDRLQYFLASPTDFFGTGFTAWESTGLSLWNSVIHSGIALGVPFTLILAALYVNFARRFQGHSIVLTALLFGSFFTEVFFWRWLFVYLAFSGLVHNNGWAPFTTTNRSTLGRAGGLESVNGFAKAGSPRTPATGV